MAADLIAAFEALGHAAEKVLQLVAVIVRLNYELVSVLLSACAWTVSALERTYVFLSIAVTDFIDQYGDWCDSLLALLSSILLFVWETANGLAQLLYSIPLLLIETVERAIAAVFRLPFVAVDSVRSLTYTVFSWISDVVLTMYELINRAVVFSISLPVALCRQAVDYLKDVDFTPLFAFLIISLLTYLWYTGYLSYLMSYSYSVARRIAVKCLIWSWQVIEALLYIFAPQVALTIRIIRLVWRPVLRICRAMLGPCLRLCRYVFLCILRILYRFSIFRYVLPERRHHLSRRPVTAAPKRPEQNANADRLVCCVCQDFEKTILIQPCNHLCLCANCVEQITGYRGTNKCPMCRGNIRSFVDVYL